MNSLPSGLSEANIVVSLSIEMLVGDELLSKARALSNRPEDEIARGCGYVGPSGRVLRKSFYRALVEAKGYKLPSSASATSSSGGARGRQAEFRTRVHGNGNLLIGHAYTRRLGLTPGQEFRIELNKDTGTIALNPMNDPDSAETNADTPTSPAENNDVDN